MMNNADRAARAEAALIAYIDHTGDSLHANGIDTWIGDLCNDLRHLCNRIGIDFEPGSGEMFEQELKEDDAGHFAPSVAWYVDGAYTEEYLKRFEKAARKAGWDHGGDCGGIWFHKPTWHWKAAVSWAGTDQEPKGEKMHPKTYGDLNELAKSEEVSL